MRAAVLADIHGNLPALEAVLLDVERVGVDVSCLTATLPMEPCQRRPWNDLPN
jgi:hypothetical protein